LDIVESGKLAVWERKRGTAEEKGRSPVRRGDEAEVWRYAQVIFWKI